MKIHYDKIFKVLHYLHAKMNIHARHIIHLPPLQIFLNITFRCNLACDMCFHILSGASRKPQYDEMTKEEYTNIIDQISRMTLITFTGGEPFIRNDALDLMEYTARRHSFTIVTNGTLLDEKTAASLVELAPWHLWQPGLLELCFSIEGFGETHDKITRRKGSFDKTIRGIDLIGEARRRRGNARYPQLSMRTVIMPENVRQLPDLVDLAHHHGITQYILSIIDPAQKYLTFYENTTAIPRICEESEVPTIDPTLMKNVLIDIYRRARRNKTSIVLSPISITVDEIAKHYQNAIDLNDYTCALPYSKTIIQSNGDVFSCPTWRLGNVKEEPLKQIIFSEKHLKLLSTLHQHGTFSYCTGCCGLELKKNKGPTAFTKIRKGVAAEKIMDE